MSNEQAFPLTKANVGIPVVALSGCLALSSVWGGEPVKSLLETRQENVTVQEWDLSCGAAAVTTLLRYQHGDPVTEREVATGLISRAEYIKNPELVQIRQGFSLLDLKRYVDGRGYVGSGYGKMTLDDLVQRAPILVPINTHGYNHFVVFRGRMGNRVLLADPAWGNRTMTLDALQACLDRLSPVRKGGICCSCTR